MHTPPRLWMRFFRWFCHPHIVRYVEGDLTELYCERVSEKGRRYANTRFALDVLLLLRPNIIRPISGIQLINHPIMFKSYFTIGWRNLLRNKGYSIINIGGLAIGMTVAILIGLWLHHELSYDKNFANYRQIAQVMQNQVFDGRVETWGSQAMYLGPELRDNYSKNFERVVIGTFEDSHTLAIGTKTATISGSFMEPDIAEMLSLNMLAGSRNALSNINGAMLSHSAARALFGSDDPLNKMIQVDQEFDVVVVGVYEDLPDNSSFNSLDVILSWQIIHKAMEQRTGWGNSWFRCLVQIPNDLTMKSVSSAIKDAKLKRIPADQQGALLKPELFVHPMNRWHLYGSFENGLPAGGQIRYVYMFGLIGGFVLILACINFMNLSTARSEKRAKEVGVRKSIGSLRTQLIAQFFTESIIMALLSLAFAIILAQLALPWFNSVAGKNLSIPWSAPGFYLACLAFSIFTGVLSGTYPAMILSSFKPVSVLKGAVTAGRKTFLPRKILVVVQFTVSISLIVVTVVILNQVQFAQQRPIGYTINGIMSVPIRDGAIMKHFDALRQELLNTGEVEEIAATESAMTSTYTTNGGFVWQGKDPDRAESFVTMGITPEFGKTINWTIKDGRDFLRDIASDSSGFIINEAAAKYLGFQHPIGETITWGKNGEWKVIGVVKDMVTQSPFNSVNPMIFFLRSNRISWIQFNNVNMKLKPTSGVSVAIDKIRPIFTKYDPEKAFTYSFADQDFGKKFNEERRVATLAFVATVLAIFISCLGLLGLSSFMAAQRTREIGIRKVMGASTAQLWQLLSKDFVVLVTISCVIAVPLSSYFMSDWLMQYEYRVGISWKVYAIACGGALIVSLITVSFQAMKAAMGNPVNALRTE